MNVDEQRDVHALCVEMGLSQPQEGIVRGHLGGAESEVDRADNSLRDGLALPVDTPELGVTGLEFCVADLITGYGVARAAAAVVAGSDARRSDCLDGVRVIVEGFGNVGGPTALYLARLGARIVGITDAESGIRVDDGLDAAAVEQLLRDREVRELPPHPGRVGGAAREDVYSTPADLFVPAAVSGSVGPERLSQLRAAGVTTLVCGANHPIPESRLGDTRNLQAADGEFRIVADVVGSMGMARGFHHLMADGPAASAEEVFHAVRDTMEEAVSQIVTRRGPGQAGLAATALDVALNQIGFSE